MDSSAFREAALAPGKVAQSIGQNVGGLFEDVSQKIQENQNAGTIFRADLTMRKTKDAFTANLANMPDPGTWIHAWQAQVEQVRQQTQDDPRAGPEAKRMLSHKFDVWEAATTSEIRGAALMKQTSDNRADGIAAATYAAHQGHIEDANNAVQGMVENHAMSPAEAKKFSARFPSIAAQAQADTAISTNPIKAPDLIKRFEGTIEPAVFIGIKSKAEAARNAAQRENLNDASEDMANSPDGTIDPKVLSAKVKSGEITQRGADGLLARMKRQNVAEDQNEGNIILSDLVDHDFVVDKKPQETARDFSERINGIANPGLRARLTQRLQNKMETAKKEGRAGEKPVIQEQLDYMKQDFESGSAFVPMTEGKPAEKGSFIGIQPPGIKLGFDTSGTPAVESIHYPGGLKAIEALEKSDPDKFHDTFGKDATFESVQEAARLNYANKQRQFLAWAEDPANKDATPEQAAEERHRLERPDTMAATKPAIHQTTPRAITTREEWKALKKEGSGIPFIFNGRVGTTP